MSHIHWVDRGSGTRPGSSPFLFSFQEYHSVPLSSQGHILIGPQDRYGRIIVSYTWIIVSYTRIGLTPLSSWQSPWALRVTSMMTLYVFFSWMRIEELVFWPDNYLRNLRSFVSCELHTWWILRDVGLILDKVSTMRVTVPIDFRTPPDY